MENSYYSRTSNKGPSEKGTLYVKPLYRGHCLESQILPFPIVSENLREEDNLSIRDKTAEFILFPKCPLFGGSTVIIR